MSLKNKRILVTGVNGFVGSYLVKSLVDQQAKVYGLDRPGSIPTSRGSTAGTHQECQFIESDIRDIKQIENALQISKPDIIFHLAAKTFVPDSFTEPLDYLAVNSMGTANVLEAVRHNNYGAKVIFAGSSEVYGLVISSEKQLERLQSKSITIIPEPLNIPELPINENNPLRPISPYGISKLHGELLTRDYFNSFGLQTVASRAFNHEGARRGAMFVTSSVVGQVKRLIKGEQDRLMVGNICSVRDWSHVSDIVNGYCLLAEKGVSGKAYNQGSQRGNSVLSYILLTLEAVGYSVKKLETVSRTKIVENPAEMDEEGAFGMRFAKTRVDMLIMNGELEYTLQDRGVIVTTDKGEIEIVFDKNLFRPSDVPILLSDISEIKRIGFIPKFTIKDIIMDQLEESYSRSG